MLLSALAAGGAGATLLSAGGAQGLAGLRARPAGRYPRRGCGASVGGTGSEKSGALNLAGLASFMWIVRSTFSIILEHLVLIGYAADTIGSFPSRRQLGGTFRRGGEGEDKAAYLVGVSGWRGRWCGHLLVSESEPLLHSFDVCGGVLSGWGGTGSRGEVSREHWFATRCNHGSRKSVWFMRHRVESQHDSRHLVNPRFGRWSLKQAGTEHVV